MLAVVPGLVVPTLPVIGIQGTNFTVNGRITYPGKQAQGRLLNVRMANALFEDTAIETGYNPETGTDRFLAQASSYLSAGVRAFTISLQGGNPNYEGAVCTAINSNGSLKTSYMDRAKRCIESVGARGGIVILTVYYQRQDQHVTPTGQTDTSGSIGTGVVNVANWVRQNRLTNVLLEIANEYPHSGFDHPVITGHSTMANLITLAKQTAPGLKVSASALGDGVYSSTVAAVADYLTIHFNDITDPANYASLISALTSHGKPILCNEDPKEGSAGVDAAQATLDAGASWGYYREANQHFQPTWNGSADDAAVYGRFVALATT